MLGDVYMLAVSNTPKFKIKSFKLHLLSEKNTEEERSALLGQLIVTLTHQPLGMFVVVSVPNVYVTPTTKATTHTHGRGRDEDIYGRSSGE